MLPMVSETTQKNHPRPQLRSRGREPVRATAGDASRKVDANTWGINEKVLVQRGTSLCRAPLPSLLLEQCVLETV